MREAGAHPHDQTHEREHEDHSHNGGRRITPGAIAASIVALVASMALVAGGASCGRRSPVVQVDVCGDVRVPAQIDALRVSVLDAERREIRAGLRELVECPESVVLELPQRFEFQPVDGEVWIVVQGLSDGVERLRFERRAQLSTDEVTTVQLGLTQDCLGISCPLGLTCIDGECEQAPFETDEAICRSGERPDVDMGDAGSPMMGADMGSTETGPPLCPVPDMGAGALEDAGM